MADNKIITEDEYRFVNPYNFIPLGEACLREIPEEDDENRYTGYFECSMRLLTPLFIPNTSSFVRLLNKVEYEDENKEGCKGYDFFSYDDWSNAQPYQGSPPSPPDNPVIPGSEIRGAVRNVYEAAFNGCMLSVDESRELSRRSSEPKKPGILYWDKGEKGWYLKSCRKAKLYVEQKDKQGKAPRKAASMSRREYDQLKEGEEIWVKIEKDNRVSCYRKNNVQGYEKGYLHKGEYIDGKKYEAVFYECGHSQSKPLPVQDEDVILLEKVLNGYRDSKKNDKLGNEGWYREFTVQMSNDDSGILVYYAKDNQGRLYMCPACIGREAFKKTIKNLLKLNGGYQPCSGEYLCPACQLFGMMEKAEKPETYSYGSRVRFTDARLIHPVKDSSILFEQPIVLDALGEPRPSAVEFYTESPYEKSEYRKEKQGYWTYDYKYAYSENGKNEINRVVLDENQPKIRGRKYYWHGNVEMEKFKENQVNAMQQRIRPLKPGRETELEPFFHFRVYFEQLDKRQIEQLKWSLDFGSPECAHKIGRGKPLGFGSVQIIADSLHIREIDENTGSWNMITIKDCGKLNYQTFFAESGFDGKEIPEALKIMSNWIKRPEHVEYPMGEDMSTGEKGAENAAASHQWFRLNKEEKNFKLNFSRVLPDAVDDVKEGQDRKKALYKLIKKEK